MEIQLTLDETEWNFLTQTSPGVPLMWSKNVSKCSNSIIGNHSPPLISSFFWVGFNLGWSAGNDEKPVTPAKKKKERARLSQQFQTGFQTLTHWHTWSLVHPRTNCCSQGDGQLWLVSPGPSSGAGRWNHPHRTAWSKSGGRMVSRENGCVVTKRKRDGF